MEKKEGSFSAGSGLSEIGASATIRSVATLDDGRGVSSSVWSSLASGSKSSSSASEPGQ